MMLTGTRTHDVIAETIRTELAPCRVRVNVQERESDEDETVFLVTVSLDADCNPDNRKMLGLIRNIRSRLNDLDLGQGFPILSFIAQNEEQKSGLEFA